MKTQNASFAWQRVAMLYQYNAPWIKKQTIIYFLFSIVTSLVYLLIPSQTIRMGIYSPCRTILLFMFIWAPIVFTKGGDTRVVDRLIPASALEKLMFYLSYLLIVIGLACYLFPWMAEKISPELYPSEMNDGSTIQSVSVPLVFEWSTYLSTIAAMLTCFYFVIAAKRNRLVKAYLISIGVSIFLSTINTFYGVKEAIVAGYREAASQGSAASETEITEMVSSALNDHLYFSFFALAINVGLIFLLIFLSYRSLYRSNL
ncbi:MAG: hypothetical protein K2L11_00840 [Muribaculaceae bacterium]|nr:hypothetical protein [Muribaculaceae bacterium]